MIDKELFCCPTCFRELGIIDSEVICNNCEFKTELRNNIPMFTENCYWGKIPESEFLEIIKTINDNGFSSFDKEMQKKLDFTYDEDRVDWRFFLPLNDDSSILDIGAGLGRLTIPLAKISKKVVSCDQSLSRMVFLKKRAGDLGLKNVDVFVGDVFNLPLKENSFDLIIMNGVLEWVGLTKLYNNPKEAQIKSLEICRKLLKEGGHLYIGIENRYALAYARAPDHGGLKYTSYMPRFLADIYSKFRGKGPYRTYTYSKKGYEHILKRAGFKSLARFFLLYPGYNFPRIIIPYGKINILKYMMTVFKPPKNNLRRALIWLVRFPLIIRAYRWVFYSFGIIVQK